MTPLNTWCQGSILACIATSPKCNVPLEEGEAVAHEGCNILIPEHCILQRGPRPHENSLDCGEPQAIAPVPPQPHAQFRSGSDRRKCRITLLRDWMERVGWCHHNPLPWKTGSLFALSPPPPPFFFLFLFGFCFCSEKPN